jgi:hypothetical protein
MILGVLACVPGLLIAVYAARRAFAISWLDRIVIVLTGRLCARASGNRRNVRGHRASLAWPDERPGNRQGQGARRCTSRRVLIEQLAAF